MVYFITDDRMDGHYCPWPTVHIEIPERLKVLREAVKDELQDCTVLESRPATVEEINCVHTLEYHNKIKSTKGMDAGSCEKLCGEFEDVYLNENSYDAAMLSAGCALEVAKKVWDTKTNGFAAIRPPGHHAFPDAPCGFCVFNNVAICAKKAREWGAERVLIVDWDVHAGQGTQECIQDDPNILLVSIHRYQHGTFWPNLPQSAANHKFPNTVNVPLSDVGMTDSEYLAALQVVVLPLAQSFKPDLILVSCGFDAAIGDPEGEMCVSPQGFGAMTGLLQCIAPVVLLLEGGYFLPSVAASAKECLRSLKGVDHFIPIEKLHNSMLRSLLRVLNVYSDKYPDMRTLLSIILFLRKEAGLSAIGQEETEYVGERNFPIPFPTRDLYFARTADENQRYTEELKCLVEKREADGERKLKGSYSRTDSSVIDFDLSEKTAKVKAALEFAPFIQNSILAPLCNECCLVMAPNQPSEEQIAEFAVSLSKLTTHPFFRRLPFIQLALTPLE